MDRCARHKMRQARARLTSSRSIGNLSMPSRIVGRISVVSAPAHKPGRTRSDGNEHDGLQADAHPPSHRGTMRRRPEHRRAQHVEHVVEPVEADADGYEIGTSDEHKIAEATDEIQRLERGDVEVFPVGGPTPERQAAARRREAWRNGGCRGPEPELAPVATVDPAAARPAMRRAAGLIRRRLRPIVKRAAAARCQRRERLVRAPLLLAGRTGRHDARPRTRRTQRRRPPARAPGGDDHPPGRSHARRGRRPHRRGWSR
jgi:hypothetical protein